MGSVRERDTGTWEARWYGPDGKQHSRNFKLKGDANRHVRAMEHSKDQGTYVDYRRSRTPFRAVAEDWYATTEQKDELKPKTAAGYRNILDYHLLPAFGGIPVASVDANAIEGFLTEMRGAVGTKRNVLRVLGMVMKHAVRKRVLPRSPVDDVDRPKGKRGNGQEQLRVLTVEQVAALAKEVGPHYELLVTFAAYTGMRAGEIVALRVKDLDLKGRRVTVRESVSDVNGILHFVPPKNGNVRRVALPKFLVSPLEERTEDKGPDDLVFPGERGGTLRHGNFYGRVFKPAVVRALPEELHGLRFHDLRHTCASLLIREGLHPLSISRHLGHSSIEITMNRYGHLYPDDQDRLADALDKMHEDAAAS